MTSLFEAPAGPVLPKARTGVAGLDEITGGGLPEGRSTLVTGGTGCGKTLLGLQFLVAGAREYGEPGVLVTFEESAEKVTANVASLGFGLDQLQKEGLLAIHAFRPQPAAVAEVGEFDFEPLFLLLDDAIRRIGARRVMLDTIEALFAAFKSEAVVRAELGRLFRWLEDREVTAIVTGERGDNDALSRYGIEEYVSDCVIALDHHLHEEVATRRLQVVKYRGSAHETNQYPFLISARGFTVLPVTGVGLDYPASEERISTGVPRLDYMLSGGLFRGSTVLVSGAAGTGKTTLGAHLINATCAGRAGAAGPARGIRRRGDPQHALDRPGPAALGGRGAAAHLGGPADRVRPRNPPGRRVRAARRAQARSRSGRRDRQPPAGAHPGRGDLDAGPQVPPVQDPRDHLHGDHRDRAGR